MALDLFAGIPVNDFAAALAWYERLLGTPPAFVADDKEAVWKLAKHRSLFIEHRPEDAGHALHTVFIDDLDAMVTAATARGVHPRARETYANGVRKATYEDPEGNELSFGSAPL
ncbi:VOC family protein [Streptomyces sp. NPDC005562]|uniref:VOC family protein n=1 Tax=Streptomyces sp. NPDC005562 TaxID=3154890 RepID=UPI0033B023C7